MADTVITKQPRLQEKTARKVWGGMMRWLKTIGTPPPIAADSRKRDKWLSTIWPQEPLLAGVITTITSIDKNRGWTLMGGRNQVNRFTDVLHNWTVAPGVRGWRPGVEAASLSYHTTDINAIIELGRDGEGGPLRGLYHVDPTLCQLTGNMEFPLEYAPPLGATQQWLENDFIRVAGVVNTSEEFNGLSYCSVSLMSELAIVMKSILEYTKEQLLAKAPDGLLLLKGISQSQWQDAMADRERDLTAKERAFFSGTHILASEGMDDVDAKLVALSSLPDGLGNITQFTQNIVQNYALIVGYDPREFWPISGGTLGTGKETEVQHQKATAKGGKNFCFSLQEKLQENLPDTLHFEFDERDEQGELVEAELAAKWIANGAALAGVGLEAERVMEYIATHGAIPKEWTPGEEEVSEDEERKERTLKHLPEYIERAAREFPDDPLIEYYYKWPRQKERLLATAGWKVAHRILPINRTVLYKSNGVTILSEEVETAIRQAGERVNPVLEDLLRNDPIKATDVAVG